MTRARAGTVLCTVRVTLIMNQLYMFVYVYVKIAILSPLVQSSKETQLKESLITFCLLVRNPSTWVLSCRRPSRCTRNGRCLCLRTANAANLGSRSVLGEMMIGCWNFPSWCWKRKRICCFDQTLLKERECVCNRY